MKKLLRSGAYLRLLPLIPQLPNFVRLGWRLLRDHRVPVYLKVMMVLTLLYSVSPFDVIPDSFLPGIGYLDDVTLLLLIGYYFIRWSPQQVVMEHVEAIGGKFRGKFQRWCPVFAAQNLPAQQAARRNVRPDSPTYLTYQLDKRR